MSKLYRGTTPAGVPIIGTVDILPCCALAETYAIDEDGTVTPEYDGESRMYWDGQYTEEHDGELLYQCSEGLSWTRKQITWTPVEDDLKL
jgi:hypothetical protein